MKLTAAKLKTSGRAATTTAPGSTLLVRPDGRKRWVFRSGWGAAARHGPGQYPEVSLAAARERAGAARAQRRAGVNPIAARRAERAAQSARPRARTIGPSRRWPSATSPGTKRAGRTTSTGRSGKARWPPTPIRARQPGCGGIDRAAVLDVLEPIWTRAPETASRLRGRIEIVLDYAAAKGWRTDANPARWRDLRHDLPAPKKVKPVVNQPALPWQQMPAFMAELRAARRRRRERWSSSS